MLEGTRKKIGAWRLPWRIPVPNRDDLIAMGLMALAFGLMVGVAIGPGLGNSSNAGATVASGLPPAVTETPATDEIVLADPGAPVLGAPAGSETSTSGSLPDSDQAAFVPPLDDSSITPDASSDPAPVEPDADEFIAPEKRTDPVDPPKSLPGSPLKGTVVSLGVNEKSYAVADEFGNVLALHGSTSPPLAGYVSTRIAPLANGTFGEELKWTTDGEKTGSPLRGVVSWIDPATGWIAISSRGASIAVDAAEPIATGESQIEIGSQVEGDITFPAERQEDPDSGPLLLATGLEAIGDPGDFLELNGRVLSVDPEARLITMAPDSGGRIDAEISIQTPRAFDPETVDVGRTFNATADVTDGGLVLTGLSADYSRNAANDLTTAFGDLR